MAQELSKGDRVSWDTSQGRTHGKIVEKKESVWRLKPSGTDR